MWQLAPKLGAMLVFAEHRYEGESVPALVGLPNCMAYCSSVEALADYATVTRYSHPFLLGRFCDVIFFSVNTLSFIMSISVRALR